MTRALPLLLLIACNGADGPKPGADAPPADWDAAAMPRMDDLRLLTRASLDLRGVRPSRAELQAVIDDPAQLEPMINAFVDDPRFGERVVSLWSEVYLTRADFFRNGANDYGLDDEPGFARAVGEEPLRLLARVAVEDRPWTEIVTADWTVADPQLAAAWPLEREAGDGWTPARYTDGRPAAGVLSTNGLWARYTSTASNLNRKRANQISRLLVCNDYLVHPIEFDRDVDLLDAAAVESAVRNDPGCVGCHVSLDPLAAYLFGFWATNEASWLDGSRYHPERELTWVDTLGTPPAWYGQPGANLGDLGLQIAADPRFASCAVEQAFSLLLRRPPTLSDEPALLAHREAFLAGDARLKALVRSVLADPRYRAGDSDDPRVEAFGGVPTKLATPDLLSSQIEGLTGYRWSWYGYDMLQTDLVGLRSLAGGADGVSVVRTATSPNATVVLVQERLAELAAIHAVTQAIEAGDDRLFDLVDVTRVETPEARAAQLQSLHLAVFGREVALDGDEVAANAALWGELYALDQSPEAAWAGVLIALLRDPDLTLY
jgi:hypothetical protein